MSHKKYFNEKSNKYELTLSKSRLFFIFLGNVDIIADAWMFFLISLSCNSFYIMPPCLYELWLFPINANSSGDIPY